MGALSNGHHDIVQVLLSAGADVNIKDKVQSQIHIDKSAFNCHNAAQFDWSCLVDEWYLLLSILTLFDCWCRLI